MPINSRQKGARGERQDAAIALGLVPIGGYPGYWVSSAGEVFSTKQDVFKTLAQTPTCNGYPAVCLSKGGKHSTTHVHRIVASAFCSKPEDATQVNHIDGDKNNNRADNLEWCTAAENLQHAKESGLWAAPRGVDNGQSKLNEKSVGVVWSMWRNGFNNEDIAKAVNVTRATVWAVVNGKTWKHILLCQ